MKNKHAFRHLLNSTLALSVVLVLGGCGASTSGDGSAQPSGRKSTSNVSERLDKAFADAIERAENTENTQEAVQIYEEIISLKPNDPYLNVKYARALREDGQLKAAESVLKPYITGEQPNPEALTEMAMVHLTRGEFKNAELSARETITILPENGRAFLALGTALDAQKYHEQAETAFRRGIEYWNGDPAPILNNLALNLASQGKLDEAIGVLERARETSPNRREIERNYRIISTLRETAGPQAPKPETKPTPPESIQPAAAPTTTSNLAPARRHSRPQPILENDPALKTMDMKKDEAPKKVEVKVVPKKEEPKTEDKAEEVQKEDAEEAYRPVLLGPRTIQNWKKKSTDNNMN